MKSTAQSTSTRNPFSEAGAHGHPPKQPKHRSSAIKRTFPETQRFLLITLFIGDFLISLASLCLSYWIRFKTPLANYGPSPSAVLPNFSTYIPLIFGGSIIYMASLAYLRVYDAKTLLRPFQALSQITKATVFWYITYLFLSLLVKTEPSISRFFATIAVLTTFISIGLWRYLFHHGLMASKIRERITQNVVLVGWNAESRQITEAIHADSRFAYSVIGYVETNEHPTEHARICKPLGFINSIENIVAREPIDILIICDFSLGSTQLLKLNALCEKHYIQFKIVPSFFRTFVTSLHMQTVSGVPVLGVEDLKILRLGNSILKRATDIFGALVGLSGAIPIMLVLAYFIKKESPGPIFYRQKRTGKDGHDFWIYKLRSMRTDAEVAGAQWAVENDPRRTNIGTFMRETNLDEIPQFWNVLIGDMSLVGPRPERPELIEKFVESVPHYNPRHAVRPGITGWAQVNGLRGNTSLRERIKFDLYYIENWSWLFDFQIMLMTFKRNKNAY